MIADVAIRLAKISDAEDIAVMSRDFIEHGLPWTWTADRIAAAILEPDTNVAVVGERGAITAFGIMSYPHDDAHLLLFAVKRPIGGAASAVQSCAGSKKPHARPAQPAFASNAGETTSRRATSTASTGTPSSISRRRCIAASKTAYTW
jgi:hypothetical protein